MKAKKLLLTLIVGLAAAMGYTQNGWVWLKQFTQSPNPNLANELDIYQVRYAQSGNIYVLGSFKSHFILNGVTYNGYSPTKLDIFIAKFDSDGNVAWVKTVGGSEGDQPDDLAIDASENLYVSGFFQGTCDFGTGNTLTSDGGNDGFLAKYNSNGVLQWVRKAAYGSSGNERVSAITVGKDGNLYVAGMSQSTSFTVGDGTNGQNYTNADSNRDLFTASFTPAGVYRWSKQIPGNNNSSLFRAIAVDETNSLYVGGALAGTLTLDGTPYTSAGSGDIILVKASPTDGTTIWVRKGGSTSDDQLNSIAVYDNFTYIIGYIQGTGTIDSTATQQSSQFTTAGSNDIFVAKYNLDGRLIWKRTIGSTGGDVGYGLNVFNNILVATGYFSNSINFNLNTITSGGNNDAAFFVFDVESNAVLARSVSGTQDDRGQGIALDTLYNVYFGGYFTSPTLTVGTNTLTNSGSGYKDLFLTKNHNDFTAAFTYKKNVSCNGGSDGALTVTPYFGIPPYSYSWKLNGNPYAATDSSITNLAAGTYEVTVTDNNSSQSTVSYTVTQPAALSLSHTQTNVSCYGEMDGTINLTVSGGTSPFSYFWTTENGSGHVIDAEDQNSLGAGDYQVTVTDVNGCQTNDNYTITQPTKISIAGTVTNITGAGSNGAVDITVSGGSGTYSSYSWKLGVTEVATTEDISDLDVGGTYKVIVTDNTSCKDSNSFVVLDERNFHAWVSAQTNVNCKGESTGEVTVSYAENIGTVTVLWSSGETTFTITGKPAGSYTATLTDDNDTPGYTDDDKTAVVDVDITEPAQILDGTIVSYPTSCYGGSDGILDLTPSGGTGPYTYSWNTSPVRTTQDINNLQAGTYEVTITDSKGCTTVKSGTVNQPADISFDFLSTQPTCYNTYTGSLSVNNLTGGTAPYSYLWSNTLTTPTISNIKSGNYWLKVTDSKGCNKTNSTYLSQPSDISISHSENKPTCPESKNGSIGLTVSGGTPGYTYFWSGPDIVNATDKDQVNLGPGTYNVTVTDANSCTKDYQVILTSANPTPTVNLTTNDADNSICPGTEVIFTANGGSTYEFFLNGLTVQGPGTAYAYSNSTLADGDQVFAEVTSAAGCKASTNTITITVFTLPTVTANASQNPICQGDGVTLTGGGAVSYVWDKGVIDGQVFYPASTDTYTVIGTDANGCQNSAQITVTVNPVPNAVISTTDPLEYCADQTVSTLFSASPSDGSFYQWIKDGQNISGAHTNTYTATEPGFYSVYLIKNGCWSISDEIEVIVHPLPTVTLTDFTPVCVDAAPFALDGGSPTGGVYSGNGVSGSTFDPAAAGAGTHTITYTYTDGNGCVNSDSKDITVNPLPTVTLADFTPVCVDAAPFTLDGGSPTGGVYSGNGVSGSTFDPAAAGAGTHTITYTYTDGNGCVNSASKDITVNPLPTVTLADLTPVCVDAAPIPLDGGSPTGGVYSGNGVSGSTFDPAAAGAGTHTITYTYTDGNGCVNSEAKGIIVKPLPSATISTSDPTDWCEGTTINVTFTAETADSYQWLLNGNPISGETNPTLNVSAAGIYSLSATTNGCTAIGNTIEISVISTPAVSIETTDPANWCEGDEVNVLLQANPSGGSAYQWRKDGNDIDQATQPQYLATEAGTYSVIATFAGGCQATSSDFIITVNPLPVIDLPDDTIRIDTTQQYTLDAGTGLSSYLWNNSTTEQTLLVDGQTYGEGIFKFWVTVTNEFGCAATDTAVIKIALPNSLPTDKMYSISIYPNPTTGNFSIKITGFEPGRYKLEFYNAIGNKVRSRDITIENTETDITDNMERLPKGLYYIRFGNSKKYLIRKLILE
ncbi:T9SS type A sorting domain-containing protein [Tenuifilum osseticum]|uniref:T9SS type A sorting domain-containing protein n=2 Tax=Tenuifilum TaxID=2760873 RepID=UPI0034E4BFDC